MELQKDQKEFCLDTETKNIDPEQGIEIQLDASLLNKILKPVASKKQLLKSSGIGEQTEPTELEEAEELFHNQVLDFEEAEDDVLNFETEDLLPESIIKEEIIKLLEETDTETELEKES